MMSFWAQSSLHTDAQNPLIPDALPLAATALVSIVVIGAIAVVLFRGAARRRRARTALRQKQRR